MKYSLIFAATAAAYEAYPAQSSSTPIGYTTVVPGYGKQPVTVTKQHQPYPTCVSAGYGDKSCDKWAEDLYVSTVIKDADKKDCTVTKTNEPVTVYHTKKTITHSATGVYNGYASPTGGYAHPTGYPAKNETGCWYELYEKIETAEYKNLGPHALPGYPGSGLCKDSEKEQKVHVKEYKGGKWSEYEQVHSYGVPEPEITHFPKPGVYEIPAKDVTVEYPVTKEGAVYAPGVYHQDATTITVTKTNEAYTCQYKQTKVYSHGTPTGKYPTKPTGAHDEYGYTKPSATPSKPTEDETSYPQYPVKGNGTHGYDSNYPTSTPIYSKPSYNGEDYPNGPHKASSTPCSEDKLKPTPSASKPAEYNNYPVHTPEVSSKAPEYPAYPAETPEVSSKAPGYPAYPVETPKVSSKVQEYPSYPQETPSHEQSYPAVPAKASSTPCSDEVKKPTPTASKPAEEYPAYPVKTPEVSSKAPEYPAYPAETPKVSSKAPEYGNGYGAQPEPTKAAYGGYKRASFIERRRA